MHSKAKHHNAAKTTWYVYIKKQNHCNMAKQYGMHQSAKIILHGKSRGPYSTTEKSSCKH